MTPRWLVRAWDEALEEARERSLPQRVVTVNGFRQPKRGLWRLEMPGLRSLVPAAPRWSWQALAAVAASLGAVLLWHVSGFVPGALMLPLFGMATLGLGADTLPVVESTADRNAHYPSPLPNQHVFNKGTGNMERFDPAIGWVTEVLGVGPTGAGVPGTSKTVSTALYARGTSGNVPNDNAVAVAAAMTAAPGLGATIVNVVAAHLPYTAANVPVSTTVRLTREGGNPTEFDVEAYGATPTSAVDSTVSLQRALDAQTAFGYGTVRLPGPAYAITTLRYYTNTILRGHGATQAGAGGTQLIQINGTAAPMLQPNTPAVRTQSFLFEDFAIYAGNNASNLGGIDCTGCAYFTINRVTISTCSTYGFRVVGGSTIGDAGFGNLTRVAIVNSTTGTYAFLSSSSAVDQPDGMTMTNVFISSAQGTWIKYACVGGRPGAGTDSWIGLRCESPGGSALADITFDPAGSGPVYFTDYRLENTGTGGIQITLNGFGPQPAAIFDSGTFAPGVGGFTWIDNGPVLSRRTNDLNGATNGMLFQVLGLQTALRTVSGNTSLTQNDHTVLVDATSGNVTITLPTPSAAVGNSKFYIKKIDASVNTVTITPSGLNIDGSGNSLVLATRNQAFELQTDGANWFITGAHAISNAALQLAASSALSWGSPNNNYLQIDGTPKFIWALSGTTQLTMTTNALAPSTSGGKQLGTSALPFSNVFASLGTTDGDFALTWGASVAVNAQNGNHQRLTATSNIAATVSAPTNPPAAGQSQDLTIEIFNNSGGALTTPVAFATGAGAFLASGGVSPANGLTIEVKFRWDQARSRYIEVSRGAAV